MNPMLMAMSAGGGLSASLVGDDVNHTRISASPANCTSGVSLNSDGTEYAYSSGGSATGTNLGTWRTSGASSNFWTRCTLNSGTLDAANSGTGTWIANTSTLGWAIIRTTDGVDTGDFDLEIATDSGGSTIVASANYTPSANRLV